MFKRFKPIFPIIRILVINQVVLFDSFLSEFKVDLLVTPSFTLVIVEGGIKSTSHFKKLMLRRIKWQAILEGGGEIVNKEEWEGVEDNTCVLVHEGQIRERKFKKWGNLRDVDTDQKARDALAKAKLENYWVMAKSLEKGGTS